MRWWPLSPLVALLAASLWSAEMGHEIWGAPTLTQPLGTDEFGRNMLLVLLIAGGRSMANGFALSIAALVLGTGLAYIAALRRSSFATTALRMSVQIIESIPVFLWVLATISALRNVTYFATPVAFILAILPAASAIIAGEFERLDRSPFLEASRLLRVSRRALFFRHVLPNAWPVLGALFIHV